MSQTTSPPPLEVLDKNMAARWAESDLMWFDVRALGIEGQGWPESETGTPFVRLPARAEGVVPPFVWQLSRHSAGLVVRFVTDSTTIAARWTLRNAEVAMPHMPASGVSGVDLYVLDESHGASGRWRWLGVGTTPQYPDSSATLASAMAPGRRQYALYLPLYNGVTSVELGIADASTLAKAPAWDTGASAHRPVLFYGTSIVQGGCASRPGMAHPAIIGRRLRRPTINLGFSGNGKMDPPVVDLLAELDPSVYVIDCVPNLPGAAEVSERTPPLVRKLRAARPRTPIMLVESLHFCHQHHLPETRKSVLDKNRALRAAYESLRSEGVKDLHYVPGDRLVGDDDEGTVDGVHPTDVGFMRYADALVPVLKPLIG